MKPACRRSRAASPALVPTQCQALHVPPEAFVEHFEVDLFSTCPPPHPAFKREDRLGKEPFAGFGTVVEDITESGYTKNQPILLGPF